jgi:predicted regulator of Ras-like GTPase activity (Roadblock/LC7/MglB family)
MNIFDTDTAPELHSPCHAPLERLLDKVAELHGAVLSRSDGFEVASVTRRNVPVSRLSALASSMVALGQASLRELGLAGGGTILVEGPRGKLLLLEVPHQTQPMVLAVVGGGEVVTGSMLWAARECAQQLLNIP